MLTVKPAPFATFVSKAVSLGTGAVKEAMLPRLAELAPILHQAAPKVVGSLPYVTLSLTTPIDLTRQLLKTLVPLARDCASDTKLPRAIVSGLCAALHSCLGDALFDKPGDPLRALV